MIQDAIKPETELEKQIISDPDFIEGAMWGKPRNGHPEGLVIHHIKHVLDNVDKYSTPDNREKLRLIAIIHDAFKYKVNRNIPKHGDNHHAFIARKFAEKYTQDEEALDIIELHDDAYNAWKSGEKGNWIKAEQRANKLIDRLGKSIDLYLIFYQCDNNTGNKETSDYNWFINLI